MNDLPIIPFQMNGPPFLVLGKGVLSLGWNRGMKSSVFMQECGTLLPLYPTICQGV